MPLPQGRDGLRFPPPSYRPLGLWVRGRMGRWRQLQGLARPQGRPSMGLEHWPALLHPEDQMRKGNSVKAQFRVNDDIQFLHLFPLNHFLNLIRIIRFLILHHISIQVMYHLKLKLNLQVLNLFFEQLNLNLM
jgi:hypothetical protein